MKKIGFSSKEFLPLMNMFNSLGKYISSQIGEINNIDNNLFDIIIKNQNIDVETDKYGIIEVNMRITHYFLFDYEPSLLGIIKIDKNFKEAMDQNILSIFEVIEHGKGGEYVILKDLINNTDLKIEGEFDGSDFSLNDLELGRIIASRLIKYDSKWFLLKNYYYYYQNDHNINNVIDFFKEKTINLYDLELIINYILFGDYEEISTINYYKRVVNVLKKYLTKKELKTATSFLKNFDTENCFEFIKYVLKINLEEKFYKEINKLLFAYMVHNNFTEAEINNLHFKIISFGHKSLFDELKGKSNDIKREKFKQHFNESMVGFFDNKSLEEKLYNTLLEDIISENYREIDYDNFI
ncbi:MAG: hypothetical protein Q8K30_02130 [Candidatus Gracilibacteria bacterium]|nr:hypothetical protein [Candidatus Gracilibacteria bacterium]